MNDPLIRTCRFWKGLAIFLGLLSATLMAILVVGFTCARYDLMTHYNLYYLMWKSGYRRYEAPVALSGMFHDISYRDSLIGMSVEEFLKRFPATFYEVKVPPPIAAPNQRWFVDDYAQSIRPTGPGGMCWEAVFENNRLIHISFHKG